MENFFIMTRKNIEDITVYTMMTIFFIIIGVYLRTEPLTLLTAILGAIIMFTLLIEEIR